MKIVFIIPTLKIGGMERVVSVLANYTDQEKYKVHVIFLEKNKAFYKLNKGIKTYYPDFGYSQSFISKFIFKVRLLFFMRRTVLKIKPKTVFGIPQKYNNLSILALIGTKVPIYISDRSNPNNYIGFGNEILRKWMYPRANGVMAQTIFAMEKMKELGINNSNYQVIPNPVKDFKPIDFKNKKDKIVINVGRLNSGKNQKTLIDIFNSVNDGTWKLLIIGGGPLEDELYDYVKSQGVTDKVKMMGPRKDIDEWLAISEIFAFTSLSEGFPNALLEALCFPLACISYDCDAGPREMIINNVNGYLVPLNDEKTYTEKLKLLMGNENLRKSFTKESLKLRDEYSVDKIGSRFLNFVLGELNND